MIASKASLDLLKLIAKADAGEGVVFESQPRCRWAYGARVFNVRTFYPLDRRGLIDVGNGHSDPVRITEAGRNYLRELGTSPTAAPKLSYAQRRVLKQVAAGEIIQETITFTWRVGGYGGESVTSTINALVKRGLVEENAIGENPRKAVLTDAGRAAIGA